MKPEDKQLLFVDLSARLPYGVKCFHPYGIGELDSIDVEFYGIDVTFKTPDDNYYSIEQCKPYLRPMSSMTKEEIDELKELCSIYIPTDSKNIGFEDYGILVFTHHLTDNSYSFKLNLNVIDWLNKNMFDYHGLIEKGLALEASEDMYKI